MLAGAAVATATVATPTAAPAEANLQARLTSQPRVHHAVQVVIRQKGDPYVYGADGPNAFDCSGLMEYAFQKAGVYLPRTADAQSQYVRRISAAQATRGDFVFYYDSSGHVYHVVMVAGHHDGNTYVLEAAHTGTRIRHNEMWSAPHFYGSLRHAGWRKNL